MSTRPYWIHCRNQVLCMPWHAVSDRFISYSICPPHTPFPLAPPKALQYTMLLPGLSCLTLLHGEKQSLLLAFPNSLCFKRLILVLKDWIYINLYIQESTGMARLLYRKLNGVVAMCWFHVLHGAVHLDEHVTIMWIKRTSSTDIDCCQILGFRAPETPGENCIAAWWLSVASKLCWMWLALISSRVTQQHAERSRIFHLALFCHL